MLCDAHTHWKEKMTDDGVIRVVSLLTPEIPENYNGLYSVGVHPMFATFSVIPSEYDGLFSGKNCCAIGECGLDRRAKLPMQDQMKLFLAHAEASERYGKPLVIHCVRAQNELLNLYRDFRPGMPWIIHGCRGKREKVLELADAGFYLSFGEGLLLSAGNMEDFFPQLPLDRILLETDEADVTLDVLAATGAQMMRRNVREFQAQVWQNFKKVFSYECN